MISLFIDGYYFGSKSTVFWDVFRAVTVIDIFWEYVLCGSS
jgi:hypothetical protein